jgi:Tfp pilus assembly protein PilF
MKNAILNGQPDQVNALNLLGVRTAQSGEFGRAALLFDRAIDLDPGRASIHCNRGLALQGLGQWEAALACFERAISLDPDYAQAHFNLANTFKDLGRLEAALRAYDRAVALDERYADAYCNRGVVLNELKRLDEAVASYDCAIALEPAHAAAQCNKSFTLLLRGDFTAGWSRYEWRWQLPGEAREKPITAAPLWTGGDDLSGRTLLLRAEQGLGDTLQFCRYVPRVAALGATVILEAQRPLLNLLADLDGVSQLLVEGAPLPRHDYYCPLLTLPLALGTRLDTIPSAPAYLRSDPAKVDEWQARLGERTRPRVGLVWSGSVTNRNDRNRSIPLTELWRHLPGGLQYVSLQKDLRAADAAALQATPAILNLANDLLDFSDTAALCECMDVVVCVDTSVAHLCGALGKRTWVLLPFSPAWRWLLDRNDSPWYPSIRLYRQHETGQWSDVLGRLADDLIGTRF